MNRTRCFVVAGLLLAAPRAGVGAQEVATWSEVDVGRAPSETPRLVSLGERIYRRACVYCHGEAGDGGGVAERYMVTKPRDFTAGRFKIRTTATGSMPTDEDLYRTITTGFPEFRMPRFDYLTPEERWALVYFIKQFSSDFGRFETEYPSVVGPPPAVSDGLLALGAQMYRDGECGRCHGDEGRGDGPSAATLKDEWGHRSRVAAFALGPRAFKRGSSASDIVQTFLTGLMGTPMPSYDGIFTDEQVWALAYHVRSLADAGDAGK